MLDLNNKIIYRDAETDNLKVEIDKNRDLYFFPYVFVTGATDVDDNLRFNSLIRERIFTGKKTILVKPLGWEDPINPVDGKTLSVIDVDVLKNISPEEPVKPEDYDSLKTTDERRLTYDELKKEYDSYKIIEQQIKNCKGKKIFKEGYYVVGKPLPPINYSNTFTHDDSGYVRQVLQSTIRVRFDDTQKDTENIENFVWRADSHTIKKDNMTLLWLCPEINGNDLFYIQSIEVFTNPKTNDYMWHDVTFKSVNESLRTVGKNLIQAIQFGQPGETFFKPNVISTSAKLELKTNDNGEIMYDINNNPIYDEIPQTKRAPTLEDINNDIKNMKEDEDYKPLFFSEVKGVNSLQLEIEGSVALLSCEIYGHKKERDPSLINIITPLWIEKFLQPKVSPLSKNYQYEQQHLIIPDGNFASINYALNWKQDQEINFNPNDKRHNRGSLVAETFDSKIWDKGWTSTFFYGLHNLNVLQSIEEVTNIDSIYDIKAIAIDGLKVDTINYVHLMNYINMTVASNTLHLSSNNDVSNIRFHGDYDIKKEEWQRHKFASLASATNLFFDKSVDIDGKIIYDSTGSIINESRYQNSSNLPIFTNATKADCLNYMNLINKKIVTLEPYRVKWEDYRGYYTAWLKIIVSSASFFMLFLPVGGIVKLVGGALAQQIAPQITSLIPAEWATFRSVMGNGLTFSFPYMISRSVMNGMLSNLPRAITGMPIIMFATDENPFSQILDTTQFRDVYHWQLTDKVMVHDSKKEGDEKNEIINLEDVVKGEKKIKLGYDQTTISYPKDKDSEFVIDCILLKVIGNRNVKVSFMDDENSIIYYYEMETQSQWSGNMKEVYNTLLFNYGTDNYSSLEAYKKKSVLDDTAQSITVDQLEKIVPLETKEFLFNSILDDINHTYTTDQQEIENFTTIDQLLEKKNSINTYTIFAITLENIRDNDNVDIVKKDITKELKDELILLIDNKLQNLYTTETNNIIEDIKLQYTFPHYLENKEEDIKLKNLPTDIEQNLLYTIEKYKNLLKINSLKNSFTIDSSNADFNIEGLTTPQDIIDLKVRVNDNINLTSSEKSINIRELDQRLLDLSTWYKDTVINSLNTSPIIVADYTKLGQIINDAVEYYGLSVGDAYPVKPNNFNTLTDIDYDKYKYVFIDEIFARTKEKLIGSLQKEVDDYITTKITNLNSSYDDLKVKTVNIIDNTYNERRENDNVVNIYSDIIADENFKNSETAYDTVYDSAISLSSLTNLSNDLEPYMSGHLYNESTTNIETMKTVANQRLINETKTMVTLKEYLETYIKNKINSIVLTKSLIVYSSLYSLFYKNKTYYYSTDELEKTISDTYLITTWHKWPHYSGVTDSIKPSNDMTDYPFSTKDYTTWTSYFTSEFGTIRPLPLNYVTKKSNTSDDLYDDGINYKFINVSSKNKFTWYNARSARLKYIRDHDKNIDSSEASVNGQSKYGFNAYRFSLPLKQEIVQYIDPKLIKFKPTISVFNQFPYFPSYDNLSSNKKILATIPTHYFNRQVSISKYNAQTVINSYNKAVIDRSVNKYILNNTEATGQNTWLFNTNIKRKEPWFSFCYDQKLSTGSTFDDYWYTLSLNSLRIYEFSSWSRQDYDAMFEPAFYLSALEYTTPQILSEDLKRLKQFYIDSMTMSTADFWTSENTLNIVNSDPLLILEKYKNNISYNTGFIWYELFKESYKSVVKYLSKHPYFNVLRTHIINILSKPLTAYTTYDPTDSDLNVKATSLEQDVYYTVVDAEGNIAKDISLDHRNFYRDPSLVDENFATLSTFRGALLNKYGYDLGEDGTLILKRLETLI